MGKKHRKSSLYLSEDKDIIDRLADLNGKDQVSNLTVGIPELQILSLLRTRKTYRDASETQDRFNWVIIVFTLVQGSIAFFSFAYQIFPQESITTKVLIFGLVIVSVTGVFFFGFKKPSN